MREQTKMWLRFDCRRCVGNWPNYRRPLLLAIRPALWSGMSVSARPSSPLWMRSLTPSLTLRAEVFAGSIRALPDLCRRIVSERLGHLDP